MDIDTPTNGKRRKRKKNYVESDSECEGIELSEDEFRPNESSSSEEEIPEDEIEDEIDEDASEDDEEVMDVVKSPPKQGKVGKPFNLKIKYKVTFFFMFRKEKLQPNRFNLQERDYHLIQVLLSPIKPRESLKHFQLNQNQWKRHLVLYSISI